MSKKTYGHTRSGQPITDADVQRLAEEAERGYDVDAVIARRNKRGRPALGSAPASVEPVRLGGSSCSRRAERRPQPPTGRVSEA